MRDRRDFQKEGLVAQKIDAALIKRLFVYLLPYKFWLLLALVFMILARGIEAFVPIYMGRLVQHIVGADQATQAIKEDLFHHVMTGSFLMLGLLFTGYLMDVANVILKSKVGQQAIYNLRKEVYQHILAMPIDYFNRNPIGRLMTRTIHDVDQIDLMMTDSVIPLLGNIFLFFAIFAGMFYIDWRAALLFLLILPFVVWVIAFFRSNQRRCYEKIRVIVSAMNTFIQEHLSGLMTIRHFGLEAKEKQRFQELNREHCDAYMESVKHFGFFISAVDFLSNFTLISLFAILVIFTGHLQAGAFFMFSLYTWMLFRPLIDLAERYNVLQSAFAASERVFEVLDEKIENPGTVESEQLEVESLEFKDVWFAYENEHWVLKGVSFQLKKGESLGVVGFTGAGKSTIMNLLLRLYTNQKGTILINGKEISQYSLKTLRSLFGVIFQDPVLFSGTFSENISLYDPAINQEMIDKAAHFVSLDSIVDRYDLGMGHFLSERGKNLSMGEMQLVSLARVLAHNRSVIVFDEATANIDTNTEIKIQEALNRVLKIKTAVVIAHRLSTIKNMDKIIVLHEGVVAEQGTHSELLKAQGLYEKLYRLQYTQF